MITGTMNVSMTLEKANYLNSLEMRDKAMPPIRNKGDKGDLKWDYYKCPVCGNILLEGAEFCRKCGQRIDKENEAL